VRPLTHEERRAWSENMGHENEQITDKHYAKMSDDRRFEVFEAMIDDAPSIRANALDGLLDEELGACVREA